MIGTLIFLSVLGISGLSCLSDNHYCKKTSIHKEGNDTVWYDRKGREIRNGEYTTYRIREDKYGNFGGQVVGLKTGTVYEDKLSEEYAFHKSEEKQCLEFAKKSDDLAYNKYYPQYNKAFTTEISTGKIISCLWEYKEFPSGETKFRKYYFNPTTMKWPKGTAPGDMGIEITRDEYVRLRCFMCTATTFPTDYEMREKVGDWISQPLEVRSKYSADMTK